MAGKIDNSMRGMIGRSAAGVIAVATGTYGNAHALHAPVLVLNASYEPINVCAARRAIVLVLKGVAMTEEENGHFLHAARVAMRVPVSDPPAGIPPHPAPDAGALSKEHSAARPQYLPILLACAGLRRTHARPRDSALARRLIHLGEPGGLLPSLQPPQGQPDCPSKPA